MDVSMKGEKNRGEFQVPMCAEVKAMSRET